MFSMVVIRYLARDIKKFFFLCRYIVYMLMFFQFFVSRMIILFFIDNTLIKRGNILHFLKLLEIISDFMFIYTTFFIATTVVIVRVRYPTLL